MIVAIIHFLNVIESLEDLCDDDIDNVWCTGESLFFDPNSEDSNDDLSSFNNYSWRLVFTFEPNLFADHWTPFVFGLLAIAQCFGGVNWSVIAGNYMRCMLFHVVMMLFACFGYSGQAGVVIGFIHAITGFFLLLGVITRSGGKPYPLIRIGC